uniref:Glypican-3 n=1 Tax=Anolis carolinensis TaxID=28377 RepID=H9GMW5_ANOCA
MQLNCIVKLHSMESSWGLKQCADGLWSLLTFPFSFPEAFEVVVRHARNFTNLMFRNYYRGIATYASPFVGDLFTDISLYILGSDLSVNDMVNEFFDGLFPLVYSRLVNPGLPEPSAEMAECLRLARRDVEAFGDVPKAMMTRVSRSLRVTRVFLQALNLGIEVVNTTDHLRLSKDCGRALLKMWYCPHCQDLLTAKPCAGFCGLVLRGCLASVAEVDGHWREYLHALEGLTKSMRGTYDVEHVLLHLFSSIRDAITHMQKNAGKMAAAVRPLRDNRSDYWLLIVIMVALVTLCIKNRKHFLFLVCKCYFQFNCALLILKVFVLIIIIIIIPYILEDKPSFSALIHELKKPPPAYNQVKVKAGNGVCRLLLAICDLFPSSPPLSVCFLLLLLAICDPFLSSPPLSVCLLLLAICDPFLSSPPLSVCFLLLLLAICDPFLSSPPLSVCLLLLLLAICDLFLSSPPLSVCFLLLLLAICDLFLSSPPLSVCFFFLQSLPRS